jgi:hypothetical protein
MSRAIKEAIDSEKKSLNFINSYLDEQINSLEKVKKLPDDNAEKIAMKDTIKSNLYRIGIITKSNKLTRNYQ